MRTDVKVCADTQLVRVTNFNFAKLKFLPMKIGVVVFPGSNCDHDAWYAFSHNLGQQAEFLWHDSPSVGHVDAVVLPGGFAYGDYLRCGAIAKFSPVMAAVRKFAAEGGPVLGICNGFQILVESGLLPGALLKNRGLKFVCRDVTLRVEATGQLLKMPVAHGEGCYFADDRTLDMLEAEKRVVLRYVDNPNGSLRDIAGICNEGRNVMGMMPHPERASDSLLGSTDGRVILETLVSSVVGHAR
jgi:phosphoribosylformylglycinamidine synthase